MMAVEFIDSKQDQYGVRSHTQSIPMVGSGIPILWHVVVDDHDEDEAD